MTDDPETAGYRTDIRYTTHYQPELNPGRQGLALAAQGVQGPDPNKAFTHLELGCGFGLTALFHAATHPRAQFIGVDFLAEHMGWATGVAEAAGLDNIRFIRAPFAELSAHALPACDVIALHGVWSWIDETNRQHLMQTIARHLKPGGHVYVSYNALPGLAQMGPLRELLSAEYDRATGDVTERIATAFMAADRLRRAGAGYFAANPRAAGHIEQLPNASPEYLAHEFFNADWRSFYFRDVAAAMASVGLAFTGSADLIDRLDAVTLPEHTRALLAAETDPTHREMMRDFLINREFRADFFTRAPTVAATGAIDTCFALTIGPDAYDGAALHTTRGGFKPGLVTRRVMNRLQRGAASPAMLSGEPTFAGVAPDALLEAMIMLVAMGAADPVLDPAHLEERRARTDRLNRVLWAQALVSGDVSAAVSPVTGGGVHTSRLEQLFLSALARGEDPVNFAAALFDADARDQLTATCAGFMIKRLPVLKSLGIA